MASVLWFLGGLALGALLLLPVFYLGGEPETDSPQRGQESNRPGDQPSRSAQGTPEAAEGAEDRPLRRGSPSAEEDGDMDYRFYTLLPEMEVEVPPAQREGPPAPSQGGTAEPEPEPQGEPEPSAPGGAEGDYLLQVASFQEHRSAEELKARLALQGLDAEVVEAQLQDRGTWYRVRLGPFPDRAEAEALQSQLAEAGMDSMILQP